MRVEWDDIESAACLIFDIWMSGGDRRWAQDAWERLAEARLTEYDGFGLERARVGLRLLTLGHLYLDWRASAFDYASDVRASLLDVANEFGLHPFYLGQLARAYFGTEYMTDEDVRGPALGELLVDLAIEARPAVVRALVESYGNEDRLFIALWRSAHPPDELHAGDGDDPNAADDWSILNTDISSEKLAGHMWVIQGCPVNG